MWETLSRERPLPLREVRLESSGNLAPLGKLVFRYSHQPISTLLSAPRLTWEGPYFVPTMLNAIFQSKQNVEVFPESRTHT